MTTRMPPPTAAYRRYGLAVSVVSSTSPRISRSLAWMSANSTRPSGPVPRHRRPIRNSGHSGLTFRADPFRDAAHGPARSGDGHDKTAGVRHPGQVPVQVAPGLRLHQPDGGQRQHAGAQRQQDGAGEPERHDSGRWTGADRRSPGGSRRRPCRPVRSRACRIGFSATLARQWRGHRRTILIRRPTGTQASRWHRPPLRPEGPAGRGVRLQEALPVQRTERGAGAERPGRLGDRTAGSRSRARPSPSSDASADARRTWVSAVASSASWAGSHAGSGRSTTSARG